MSFQNFLRSVACALVVLIVYSSAVAQNPTIVVDGPRSMRVAERNNIYCAGYVQKAPVDTEKRIVGATDEQERFMYSEHNVVYINAGANKGVEVGDVMTVFRPRGEVKTKWTKKGDLGFYVQEVGAIEVIRVKDEVSVARVKTSCDSFLLGDLVQMAEQRPSPSHTKRPALDLFADPSGKAVGRVFMARDNQEMLGRENIVYVDLGAEDNVQVGDYLTVFRPLGSGNLFKSDKDNPVSSRVGDFGSSEYSGGGFSNMAGRKSGKKAGGVVVTEGKAKEGRPKGLRKVVGEMVVLNVKERTATAMITRTALEIHTGDWVEVQ